MTPSCIECGVEAGHDLLCDMHREDYRDPGAGAAILPGSSRCVDPLADRGRDMSAANSYQAPPQYPRSDV